MTARGRLHLALIEDEDVDFYVFRRGFAQVADLRRWSTGQAFLRRARTDAQLLGGLDGLLVDLRLPDCDGSEVIFELRQLTGGRELFVAGLSGVAGEPAIARAFAAGATVVEAKPFDGAALSTLVARITE